ncbi:hypothetical protein NA57DRAFT_33741 [Rhizodiscina lignyota]|uniref:E3 ubiquitin-protein ligase n=1 Tax=Rhizodiscina lignyota TaxID=1504668 RepID=A0A9P4IL83_9PEZI|nr:hypothetical protein NA57DRAFT_33741 [Rhizodiscina lignyota]
MTPLSPLEQQFSLELREFPRRYSNVYSEEACQDFLQLLFRFLCNENEQYLGLLFPDGPPPSNEPWVASVAQGAVEGTEYTEAARGKPCGHILRNGEWSYNCKTCRNDDTCVLCSRCFEASDHEGHDVFINVSGQNAGCCDCGDPEAWSRPVHCNIHSPLPEGVSKSEGKAREPPSLPEDLLFSIKATIARALDYFCDVFSCSPEQLRLPKTEESVREDERLSRLSSHSYGSAEPEEPDDEFCLLVWNDEKHTHADLAEAIARVAKMRRPEAAKLTRKISDNGRVIIKRTTDLQSLLKNAKDIERTKYSTTIRSSRDTFREDMCATIIEWLADLSGCAVGPDTHVLRNAICEEMLTPWRVGSHAHQKEIAKDGMFDEEELQTADLRDLMGIPGNRRARGQVVVRQAQLADLSRDDDAEDDGDDSEEDIEEDDDEMEIDTTEASDVQDQDMDDALEYSEATLAGYPPPPPPPAPNTNPGAAVASEGVEPPIKVPRAPKIHSKAAIVRTPKYWLEKPQGYGRQADLPPRENLWDRVRIDFMILFDLRLWNKMRRIMRNMFIGTVVNVQDFKRILSLRFAGLYSPLAQLYLIADREPDCSIISLSLQMLSTPSITGEVIERGNFLAVLMAIIYTFASTRQVGYPSEVNLNATLALEAGIHYNRRLHHFFADMRLLLGGPPALERIRQEERYLQQFLDLIKLYQGIVPNVRALGDHVEYETETWFNFSIMTKEISKLCRQLSEAFAWRRGDDDRDICRAIRQSAKSAIVNSLGSERLRFDQCELKEDVRFKALPPFEFDWSSSPDTKKLSGYQIVDFTVAKQPMSFHHPLHYMLSWLIEHGRALTCEKFSGLLLFSTQELRSAPTPPRAKIPEYQPGEHLLALFDMPLRECAWLAQIKAGWWVRNGNTLIHQANQYKNVGIRDYTFRRDIFMLQTALCVCPPATFLASIVDRYCLLGWVQGDYRIDSTIDEPKALAMAENFIQFLIVLLCDRLPLIPQEDEPNTHIMMMRRSIAQALCFKPLAHSTLTSQLTEKVRDSPELEGLLKQMTNYRAPDGIDDSGKFELKAEFIEEIDPYAAHLDRNQREEAENIYRKHIAKKTGKAAEDVVFEPKLPKIRSGVFKDLAKFTSTPLFAQIIFYLLNYLLTAHNRLKEISSTQLDEFLQSVLHLTLIAILEDDTHEDVGPAQSSFVANAISLKGGHGAFRGDHEAFRPFAGEMPPTILCELNALKQMPEFKSSGPKISLVLRRMNERRPRAFASCVVQYHLAIDRIDTASPAPSAQLDKDIKKKQAMDRQAKLMAEMRANQNSFMQNQQFDMDEADDSGDEDFATPIEDEQTIWRYPTGKCLHCRGDCNDTRLYGTFSFLEQSNILRQTPQDDPDWVAEALNVPAALDCSADHIRPYGVAGQNKRLVQKVLADGQIAMVEQQVLGKGFPRDSVLRGCVAVGCGHLMHYTCWENYLSSVRKRHTTQNARQQPESLERAEYSCPLCKAKGNVFLMIPWKGKQVSYPGALAPNTTFDDWLSHELGGILAQRKKVSSSDMDQFLNRQDQLWKEYVDTMLFPFLATEVSDLAKSPSHPVAQHLAPHRPFQNFPAFIPPAVEAQLQQIAENRIRSGVNLPSSLLLSSLIELLKNYQNFQITAKELEPKTNPIPPNIPRNNAIEDLPIDPRVLALSICAVEISQRGVQSEHTLLDSISTQTLTHLRVLSETLTSSLAVNGLCGISTNSTKLAFQHTQFQQMVQLFCGHKEIHSTSSLPFHNLTPFLNIEPFSFLVDASLFLVPAMEIDIHHVLRLCYLAEIVRVIISYAWVPQSAAVNLAVFDNVPANADAAAKWPCNEAQEENFARFITRILQDYELFATNSQHATTDLLNLLAANGAVFLERMRAAIAGYVLPFLRKSAILMHVKYGVEFSESGMFLDPTQSELGRLSDILHLPSLNELVSTFLDSSDSSSMLQSLTDGWMRHYTWAQEGRHPTQGLGAPGHSFSLSHPGIFELIGLPTKFATLAEIAVSKKCPTTGGELTDPAMCLWCGEMLCGQAVCCGNQDGDRSARKEGGCMRHMKQCGQVIGAFINIRKCQILFLHRQLGSWFNAPYLDKHGEVDQSLRRQLQLFLSQKRCDMFVRNLWLNHGIPSVISRKLEQEMNTGGWDTL